MYISICNPTPDCGYQHASFFPEKEHPEGDVLSLKFSCISCTQLKMQAVLVIYSLCIRYRWKVVGLFDLL